MTSCAPAAVAAAATDAASEASSVVAEKRSSRDAVLWALAHPFFTSGILGGQGLATVLGWTLEKGARVLGITPSAAAAILALLIGIHLLIGAVAGLLAWDVGRAVEARLRPVRRA